MKKIFSVLTVLLLVAGAYAAEVDCNCVHDGNGIVTVRFINNLTGDGNNVRAFSLDISADSGASIDKQSVTDENADYWVFPGSIDINDTTGFVDSNGSLICGTGYPGTLGANSNEMTIEMASLYEKGVESAPTQNGTLFKFKVDRDCTVSIAQNTIRGGIVLEDPNRSFTPGVTGCPITGVPCYTGPDIGRWRDMGEPNCWCWDKSVIPDAVPRQCRGDVDDTNEGPLLNKPVLSADLGVFLAAWNRKDGYLKNPSNAINGVLLICADMDHNPEGPLLNKGCLSVDLGIFLQHWNQKAGKVKVCP